MNPVPPASKIRMGCTDVRYHRAPRLRLHEAQRLSVRLVEGGLVGSVRRAPGETLRVASGLHRLRAEPSTMPSQDPIRFAVVGMGHIAQAAVLPAFEGARGCELVAIVSGDEEKRAELAERYAPRHVCGYDEYDRLVQSGDIDAVYVALPNELHADYTIRAARAGLHVLCEKPMAPTERECRAMIEAAERADVRLMIAYRLHFDRLNLEVIQEIQRGAIGKPRVFSSVFAQDVKPGDIRLAPIEKGGGTVYDMGIYCINAARYLFQEEPCEVRASANLTARDPRFTHCDEATSAVLTFPSGALAQFTSSFGAFRTGDYEIVGTEGEIRVQHGYDYVKEMSYTVQRKDGEQRSHTVPPRDQFAAELVAFADCIREGRSPEPDGHEGCADVRIIEAIYRSATSGRAVTLDPLERPERPTLAQEISRPAHEKPPEIKVSSPGR